MYISASSQSICDNNVVHTKIYKQIDVYASVDYELMREEGDVLQS